MAYNIKNGMFSNGIRLAGEEMYVHSGGRVEATVVDYSSLYVYHGGNARSTQVNSNGKFYVTGGQADRTDVNLQGNMFVAAGGKAENTNVKYKGALHVSVGGEARTVSAVNGSVYVSEGGLLSGGKFAENALLHVFSGGVVRDVKLQDQTLCDIYGSGSGIEASGGKIRIFGSAGELSAGRSTAVTVLSGGILTDAVLTSGASAELQSGARGHGILIGAAVSLKTAGSAAYITVGSGAVCRVTGGTAQNIVARGDLSVGKAGSAAEVVVSAGGKVFAEGRISDISVETGGELRMTGEAERITVSGLAARVDVVSGKLVSGTVGAGASMLLGGTGTLICVEKNGTLEVTSGGLLFGTDIISAGKIRISSGGTVASSLLSASEAELEGAAQKMTVGAAACLHVRGSAADSVLSGGTLIVYQQGTASGAVVTQGGVLHVSGGQAEEIVLSDRAQLTVFDGTAENISAVRGATVQVRKDGTLSKAHLGDNGTLLAGGSVSSLEVGPGGRMSVLAQGTVRDAVISSAGTLDVSSGGRAEDIEVSRGGKMTVLTSGAVEDISTYGELDIAGKVDGITMKGGVIRSEENAQISGLEISRGKVAVDGGMVQNVSAVRADITVNAGKLMETELLSGSLSVAGNGRVSHITLGTAAHFSLNSGAEGTDIVIGDGAACCISSGGMLSGAVLSGGGYLHAASGAVIRDLVWNPCDGVLEIASGAQVSFASALSGVYYGSGGYLLSSGPYFSDLAVDGEERVLYVCSDGNVKNTTVKDGGKMFVSSGGIAARTSVGAGGTLLVHSGGSAIGVDWTPCVGTVETQEGGLVVFNNALTGVFYGREDTLLLESDCVAGQDVVGERTSMYVMSDGLASSCRVTSGGKLFVRHGSAADIAAAEGGFIEIQSGGTAENVTVSSGGVLTAAGNITALSLQNGGRFNGFAFAEDLFFENTVNGSIVPFENVNVSGSRMTVDCGGRGQGVSVAEAEVSVLEGGRIEKFEFLSGSELFLAAGASAADTVISGADIVLANGGKMTGTRIESGSLSVVNGRAENVILSAEGRLFAGAGMTVTGIQLDEAARLDLVIDSKTVVNGRRGEQQFDIADGILADFTAGRGEISLREGEMRDVTLLSGASITLSGGRCSGTISLETGASLALSADTVLDFTLSGIGEKALINRLDLITGTPVYTITLSGDAAAGV